MQAVQTVAIAFGIPFAIYQIHLGVKQLKASSDASSAVALLTVMNSSADLRWKILQDPSLQAVLVPEAKVGGLTKEEKLNALRGMVIGYYAFIFNVHKLGQIPEDTWSAFRADMQLFFARPDNQERWSRARDNYQGDFRAFVDHDLLAKPK